MMVTCRYPLEPKWSSKLRLFPLNCILAGTNTLCPGLGVRSRHLILIVEDELWLGLDISEALKDEGYDVITVANADDAIKVLESRNDMHDLHGHRSAGFHGRTETGRRRKRSMAAREHHRDDRHDGASPR
jgi:hypothetical protein